MKFVRRISPLCVVILSTLLLSASNYNTTDLLLEPITAKKLEFFPVPRDYRNYFILQSIDNVTKIIIGDFVASDKVICMITDQDGDGEVDAVDQYYPDTEKFSRPIKPTTELYLGFEKTKKAIINGSIFRENYAYKMRSLKDLREKMIAEAGQDVYKAKFGFTVKMFDPDERNTIMSDFFFQRKSGRYDLHFKTNYYKLFSEKIIPPVSFSVYCRNTSEPVVKETVEELIKIMERK